jgi:rubrerythrin
MKRSVKFFHLLTLALLTAFVFISYHPVAESQTNKKKTTLDNLMEAYNGESNANARYIAFAKKADQEGYKQVARLFRAAARAEEVHFKRLAGVIKSMGGTPKSDIKTPEVKSTRENLEAAFKGETYEKDVMYPDFIKQARAEKNKSALKAFNGAKEAEAEHAKLYNNAINNMAKMKDVSLNYFVCPECGYTTARLDLDKCPVCYTAKNKFLRIS